jgi:hypothetical protein
MSLHRNTGCHSCIQGTLGLLVLTDIHESTVCRFGEIVACDIIRDRKTGDSLNYAFIGFTEKQAAEQAYLKMNNALIDDRSASTCSCSP